MAASTAENREKFEEWLSTKLQEINPDIDLDVFVSYIQGVLEDEDEDKKDSLSAFLAEIMDEEEIEPVCNMIIQKWQELHKGEDNMHTKKDTKSIDEKIISMMEQQQVTDTKTQVLNVEDKARKQAILMQYAQVSGDEDDDSGPDSESLFKNLNAAAVARIESEKRDKMKEAHEKKKERDKQEREKQKQKKEDRKEAEKKRTQKGEKRR